MRRLRLAGKRLGLLIDFSVVFIKEGIADRQRDAKPISRKAAKPAKKTEQRAELNTFRRPAHG